MNWMGARVPWMRARMNWMGARIPWMRARMNWMGARIPWMRARMSWMSARVNETRTRARRAHARVNGIGTRARRAHARADGTRARMRFMRAQVSRMLPFSSSLPPSSPHSHPPPHLIRASDSSSVKSTALNVAEAAGRVSPADRARVFAIARGEAMGQEGKRGRGKVALKQDRGKNVHEKHKA